MIGARTNGRLYQLTSALTRPRHGELTGTLVVLVERAIEAGKADRRVVDEDVKLPPAGRLDVVLDQGIGRIRCEDMLFAAGPAVAQHDPEPVLEQFAPQGQEQRQIDPLVPARCFVGLRGKSPDWNRERTVAPLAGGVDLDVVARAVGLELHAGRGAQVGYVE